MSKECTICGVRTEHIEIHHKIPQRFDGPDEFWNLEGLCRSCHVAIEKMYNKRFWEYLDMGPTSSKAVCDHRSCGAEDVRRIKVKSPKIGLMKDRYRHYCYHHAICSIDFCGSEGSPVDRIVWGTSDDGHTFAAVSTIVLCSDHRVCHYPGCESRTCFFAVNATSMHTGKLFCYTHQNEVKDIEVKELVRIAKRDDQPFPVGSA